MFKVDMEAIREAAIEARLTANPACVARATARPGAALANLANLADFAISQERSANIDPVLSELLHSAMRACDAWQDGPEARKQMRRECLDTPPHLRADLRSHFSHAYSDNA